MKYLAASVLLAGVAQAQQFHLDANGSKSHRVKFDAYSDQSRKIEFDFSDGTPRIVSDVTLPEGVGYIYIRSGNGAVLEYSRTPEYQTIRFLQSVPPVPYAPVVPF